MYRTDLAVESTRLHAAHLPPGVHQHEESCGKLSLHTVEITDADSAALLGKPVGRYVTLGLAPFTGSDTPDDEDLARIADEIRAFLPPQGTVLVVGLGNSDITPDAIGPQTARQVLATRHITAHPSPPQALDALQLRPTAVLAPGVLGQTGIETAEIISALARTVQPAAVIVVDALAAGDTARLGNTIQISNAGIAPGSGVQNRRQELNRAVLGAEVIAIGIPTVVDARVLARDMLGTDSAQPAESVQDTTEALMITPRDIDMLVAHGSRVLALAINKAVQSHLDWQEIQYLMG